MANPEIGFGHLSPAQTKTQTRLSCIVVLLRSLQLRTLLWHKGVILQILFT